MSLLEAVLLFLQCWILLALSASSFAVVLLPLTVSRMLETFSELLSRLTVVSALHRESLYC